MGEILRYRAKDISMWLVVGMDAAGRVYGVGLHYFSETLVWESAYLLLPHIDLIFQTYRTKKYKNNS